jgi:DNA-binding NarL/FixJ family response regulator
MVEMLLQIVAKEDSLSVVGVAVDGREAIQYAATLSLDLVLMDFNLPHLNGAEATRCIKQFTNPPVVFMMTLDDDPNSRMMSTAAGADAFIVKSGGFHSQLRSKLQEYFGPPADSMRRIGNRRKSP